MISYNTKNSIIYKEFSSEKQKEYFSFKQKSFIGHIDTFYYTVYADVSDWNENENKKKLCSYLAEIKTAVSMSLEALPVFSDISDKLEMRPFLSFKSYCYHIGMRDNFDIFVCETVPNLKTPSVIVQLRSQSLWLDGVKKSFEYSLNVVEKIFEKYDLKILKVRENRIDYAFHNNYIQDFVNFFPQKNLGRMIVADFKRFGDDGAIRFGNEGSLYGDGKVEVDYFTLGRRKSNNVFFRCYNKCKEVVEMGYKQFFIPIWYDSGLISKYDMYVLERAFKYGTWTSIYKARCEFYYDYGFDLAVRQGIYDMLCCPDVKMVDYKKIAEQYTPEITLITNVEFQTKRKFYDRLPVDKIKLTENEDYKSYMYSFFKQVPSLVNFLTTDTLRFVNYKGKYKTVRRSDRPVADWWERLRRCKMLELDSSLHIDYYREYQFNLDSIRSKYMTLNKIARHSSYMLVNSGMDSDSTSLVNDFNDYLASLNDNDIERYYKVRAAAFKDKKRVLEKMEEDEQNDT